MLVPEMLVLVNRDDREIGIETKLHVHKAGYLHRAFSVFIFRTRSGKKEILLQQRHLDKYHCGGLWSNTCCGHPRKGEDVVTAGQRRLNEELSIKSSLHTTRTFIYRAEFDNGMIEHELDHVLVGDYDDEVEQFNSREVQAFRWISVENLSLDLEVRPEFYTPWCAKALKVVKEYYLLL